jgi:hypothetical protein
MRVRGQYDAKYKKEQIAPADSSPLDILSCSMRMSCAESTESTRWRGMEETTGAGGAVCAASVFLGRTWVGEPRRWSSVSGASVDDAAAAAAEADGGEEGELSGRDCDASPRSRTMIMLRNKVRGYRAGHRSITAPRTCPYV